MIVYAVFWFVPLVIALAAGVLEYGIKSHVGTPPGPSLG